MPDQNALFLVVGNYCRREMITCAPSDRLTDAAATKGRALCRSDRTVCLCGYMLGQTMPGG